VVDSPPAGESDDIVLDILQRFAKRVQLHIEAFAELEAEIRREWGGVRPYVPKIGEMNRRRVLTSRDERIRAEHLRGEHVELLSRRWGLSIRRVQQIVSI
jgi:Mor family transcriptional regulator